MQVQLQQDEIGTDFWMYAESTRFHFCGTVIRKEPTYGLHTPWTFRRRVPVRRRTRSCRPRGECHPQEGSETRAVAELQVRHRELRRLGRRGRLGEAGHRGSDPGLR